MMVMDVPPDVPAQYAPVLVAEASQAKNLTATEGTIGICKMLDGRVEATTQKLAVNVITPSRAIQYYSRVTGQTELVKALSSGAKTTLLQAPAHGTLEDLGTLVKDRGEIIDTGIRNYAYRGDGDYFGPDQATFLVEVGDYKFKVIYQFRIMPSVGGGDYALDKNYCPNGGVWRISLNPDDPNAPIYTFEHPYQLTNPLMGAIAANLTIADLADGAVGQTTGSTITLDDNAAGHGWFIDSTPWSNEEWLPTHNPNEWIAKAGSDAAGKMDMLSVLLHEYGHVLGIDHSANGHDLMATTLTPGMRRMPTTDELALMADLVAGLKADLQVSSAANSVATNSSDNSPLPFPWLPLDSTLGLAFLGRLRNRLGGLASNDAALTLALSQREREVVQYAVVANPTLTNGSLDAANGWLSQGSVAFANGAAVLNEVSASQTRLSQVFMVGAQDRYLSFTIGGTALDDQLLGPDDAFEAALLDANTGASLAGALNLSRTDALFNLQANGTERLSQGITRTDNTDGSRTYIVDLTGIAAPINQYQGVGTASVRSGCHTG